MFKQIVLCLMLSAVSFAGFSCDLNSDSAVSAALWSPLANQPLRQVSLSNNMLLNVPDAEGTLAMHRSDTLALLDQITLWPTDSGVIATLRAQPVVLDSNYDGAADAVYVVDTRGLLWFIRLTYTGFANPELVADLTSMAAEFRQPLKLVQTQSAVRAGVVQRQTMLLLIASTPDNGDVLLAIKHSAHTQQVVTLTDLLDRTVMSDTEVVSGIAEPLWQQLQQGAGWYIRVDRRITAVPQVYAGVVYLTSAEVAQVNADCSLVADAAVNLHAVHLHHAGAVYARRHWQITSIDNASLHLQLDDNGELELSLQNEQHQQALLTELLSINDDCANCTTVLTAAQFPRLNRLATFQAEQGAH